MGPWNHVLDGGRDPPWEWAIFGGGPPHRKALGVSAAAYAAKGIIRSSMMAHSRRDHSVFNNGTTCDAAFYQYTLTTI